MVPLILRRYQNPTPRENVHAVPKTGRFSELEKETGIIMAPPRGSVGDPTTTPSRCSPISSTFLSYIEHTQEDIESEMMGLLPEKVTLTSETAVQKKKLWRLLAHPTSGFFVRLKSD
jgi:hypothetical protein